MVNVSIGNGGISSDILLLPKQEFLAFIPTGFKRILLKGKTDEEIETILSDLWDASNPKTDGGNTSSKKTKGTATAVAGVDSTEPIGDGAVLDGAE